MASEQRPPTSDPTPSYPKCVHCGVLIKCLSERCSNGGYCRGPDGAGYATRTESPPSEGTRALYVMIKGERTHLYRDEAEEAYAALRAALGKDAPESPTDRAAVSASFDAVVLQSDDHTGDRDWVRWQLVRAYEAGRRAAPLDYPRSNAEDEARTKAFLAAYGDGQISGLQCAWNIAHEVAEASAHQERKLGAFSVAGKINDALYELGATAQPSDSPKPEVKP